MILPNIPSLDEVKLQQEIMQAVNAPVELLYLDSCESTNLECHKIGRHNTVVIAEHQSAGRGRRGNDWHSPPGQNIYCSIGLNKSIQAEYLGLISLQTGVCIVDVLRAEGYEQVSLKWPNDILLQGEKLGGILIESRAFSVDNFYLVIGFGINIQLDSHDLDSIGQPATGLNQHATQSIDKQQLISRITAKIIQNVMNLNPDNFDPLIQQFTLYDEFHGQQIKVKTTNEEIYGIHSGIKRTGQIQVKTSRGEELFSAADISLRKVK